ncbi:MAG: hypothetical protein AMK73_08100 [Planctomycetes bacterium SM23_32]|nr:MAG: hypothetical protein AMK73_08100 [Planctomycetes bacterium SM23_32]
MYQFEMIRQSAYDATADPSLPRYEDFYESVLRPLGLQAAAWIGSGIPLMLAFGFARFIGKVEALQTLESLATGGPLTAWAGVLAAGLALSLFMFPMNLLAVAAADSAGAISPTFTFPAVAKVIGPYVVYYIFYVAVMAGAGALRAALPSLLVGEVVGVYAMTVSVRALGTLHYAYENRIGWTK